MQLFGIILDYLRAQKAGEKFRLSQYSVDHVIRLAGECAFYRLEGLATLLQDGKS